jgi:hypothetical protein
MRPSISNGSHWAVVVGSMLVVSAWMLSGLVFVLCVNARPRRTLTVASWLGGAGAAAAVLGAFNPWSS